MTEHTKHQFDLSLLTSSRAMITQCNPIPSTHDMSSFSMNISAVTLDPELQEQEQREERRHHKEHVHKRGHSYIKHSTSRGKLANSNSRWQEVGANVPVTGLRHPQRKGSDHSFIVLSNNQRPCAKQGNPSFKERAARLGLTIPVRRRARSCEIMASYRKNKERRGSLAVVKEEHSSSNLMGDGASSHSRNPNYGANTSAAATVDRKMTLCVDDFLEKMAVNAPTPTFQSFTATRKTLDDWVQRSSTRPERRHGGAEMHAGAKWKPR